MQVWKFPVELVDDPKISMPRGSRLLAFECQHGQPQVWALVDPAAPGAVRPLRVAGPGHDVGAAAETGVYVGTVQMMGGDLVLHLFDCGEV